MDDNKNKPMGWPILYTLATLAGVAVLTILKACGIISMSWPVVIAGLVWVPTALLLITLWVATLLIWIGRIEKKIKEYNRRRKISRTLDESMKGLTLNGVGPIYGIRRNKGENNTDYEKRIREKLGALPSQSTEIRNHGTAHPLQCGPDLWRRKETGRELEALPPQNTESSPHSGHRKRTERAEAAEGVANARNM